MGYLPPAPHSCHVTPIHTLEHSGSPEPVPFPGMAEVAAGSWGGSLRGSEASEPASYRHIKCIQ